MAHMFSKMVFFMGLALAYAWCTDNVIITGTVVDSATGTPIQGMRVTSMPSFLGGASAVETLTDANGKYLLNNSGTLSGSIVNAYIVSTSYPNAYQYITGTVPASFSTSRSDGVADTLTVPIKILSRTPPPDTLVIIGKVARDSVANPLANVVVKCVSPSNSLFFPNPSVSYDTLRLTTGSDGSFSFRGLNIYAINGGAFTATLPAGFDPIKNKLRVTKTAFTADTNHSTLSDGKTDTIIVPPIILASPTQVIGNGFRAINKIKAYPVTPVSVSIYSIDGRLIRKLDNVKIETLDNSLSSLHISNNKALIAVWRQNGTNHAKRIMNMTRNKN